MALKKQTEFKGVIAEYWAITEKKWEKASNSTSWTISLYVDKHTRDMSVANILRTLSYHSSGDLSISQCYTESKTSKINHKLITPAQDAEYNDAGELVTPASPAVYEDIETNILVDADDI